MTSQPPPNEPDEPSVGALILSGPAIVIGAFLSAPIILSIHSSGH